MVRKFLVVCAVILGISAFTGSAWANNIPISNGSFSSSNPMPSTCGLGCFFNSGAIPGWNETGGGSWSPGSNFPGLPSGTVIAYTNGGTISQLLTGTSVLPNSTYTLLVDVGDRDGFAGTYSIFLESISGGVATTLCTFSGNSSSIAAGTFQAEGCAYTSGSTPPGGQLFLVFQGGTGQLDLYNASLNCQSQSSSSVPEPNTLLLLTMGLAAAALVSILRKS